MLVEILAYTYLNPVRRCADGHYEWVKGEGPSLCTHRSRLVLLLPYHIRVGNENWPVIFTTEPSEGVWAVDKSRLDCNPDLEAWLAWSEWAENGCNQNT